MNARRVRTVYSYLMLFCLLVVGLALMSLLLGLLLRWDSNTISIPLAVGSPFPLVFLVLAPFHLAAKGAIRRILSGKVQVTHWTYTELEWQQFTRQGSRRIVQSSLRLVSLLAGLMVVVCLVILGPALGDSSAVSALQVALGATSIVCLVVFLASVIAALVLRGQHNREVYISLGGIILGDVYLSLSGLYRVSYQAGDPAVVRFFLHGFRGDIRILVVPVPGGCTAEAEQLFPQFQKTEPSAD